MRDLLSDYERFVAAGVPFGRAVVTSVWGSAPRPPGANLLASADGRIAGSVSGGCVESATAMEISAAIERGTPKLISYGVSDERAWEVGLACGGTIEVFVEPAVRREIVNAARGPGGVVVATVVEGPGLGTALVRRDDGGSTGNLAATVSREDVRAAADQALAREGSGTVELPAVGGSARVFLEVFPRQPKLVIFGGVHIAAALVPLAKALGYHVTVADGREAFLGRDRFPEADRLLLAWPGEAFEQVGLDRATYVCVLSHDPKFDEPALEVALRSPARYVGAIGSRKTQRSRRERLRAAGITDEQLARLRGPIGLDLGGREPAETALAIMAEMTAVRYGGTGAALAQAEGGRR
ncbi:MAG TPA: XdhC/CoxI family protein [Gemmatimonadales bacterium]|nr:XdhC/CoxI family protein [Gemmatimonadales bacterium]